MLQWFIFQSTKTIITGFCIEVDVWEMNMYSYIKESSHFDNQAQQVDDLVARPANSDGNAFIISMSWLFGLVKDIGVGGGTVDSWR